MGFKNIFKKIPTSPLAHSDPELQNLNEDEVSSPSSSSVLSNPVYSQYLAIDTMATPKELVPIVTLLRCHQARVYLRGIAHFSEEHRDYSTAAYHERTMAFVVKGTSLTLYDSDNISSHKPVTVNLVDAAVHPDSQNTSLVIAGSKVAHHLRFDELEQLQRALAAIQLTRYEYVRLNESYTASLLSSKGPQLSDLHVVLAENRFVYQEQCSLKVNGVWKNCVCVVTPNEGKLLSRTKKKGTLHFYLGSKPHKKNLLCAVSNVDNCFAVFTHVDLVDDSSIIQLKGDILLYDVDEKASLHRRTASISSSSSVRTNSKNPASAINNTSIYIMPKNHPGVKNFETLIRFLIPIYDSFQLYGRPTRLIADKTHPESLLFGLPSLPRSRLLTLDLVTTTVERYWPEIIQTEDLTSLKAGSDSFLFEAVLDHSVVQLYEDRKHPGFGHLKEDMAQEAEFEDPVVVYNSPGHVVSEVDEGFENVSAVQDIADRHQHLNELTVGRIGEVAVFAS